MSSSLSGKRLTAERPVSEQLSSILRAQKATSSKKKKV